MSEARQPILSSFFPALTPLVHARLGSCPIPTACASALSVVSLVTMKEVMPLLVLPGVVRAVHTKISPTPACVMKIFDPLRT